jgi:hypothetical protein
VPRFLDGRAVVIALLAAMALAASGLAPIAAPTGRLHVRLPRSPGAWAVRLLVHVAPRFGWPLRPFHEQHVIRSGFGEPRFGAEQRNFHFGIDLPAAGATPVYAVAGGTAFLEPDHVAVLSKSGRAPNGFSYWHIVPAVGEYNAVRPDQLLGWVKPLWGHLHFAQILDGRWVNPLRPGALTPYTDSRRPQISKVAVEHLLDGRVNVIVDASVAPARPPTPPWQQARLAPSLVRWRLFAAHTAVSAWKDAVDFRVLIPPNRMFADVYAPGTRPSWPDRPGRYRFYLAHDWNIGRLPAGRYALEVQAIGSRGLTATAYAPLEVGGTKKRLDAAFMFPVARPSGR